MYHTTINLAKRPAGYREALIHFLEQGDGKKGVYCEWGHPFDLTRLFERINHEVNNEVYPTLHRHHMRDDSERHQDFCTHRTDRTCAILIDPVFSHESVRFRIIPTGPFGEILKENLDAGRVFIPGARMYTDGSPPKRNQTVRQIVMLDLIPMECYIDTGDDVCVPFVALK